jgi:hypothetical protein
MFPRRATIRLRGGHGGGGGPRFWSTTFRWPAFPAAAAFCVWCLDILGGHFRLGFKQQILPQPERPTDGPPLRFATADGRFCVGFLDGMVLPRTGAKGSKSVRREAAFRTILVASAGEAGKAFKLAFENNAFSLAFFACRGPPSSCFSARTPPLGRPPMSHRSRTPPEHAGRHGDVARAKQPVLEGLDPVPVRHFHHFPRSFSPTRLCPALSLYVPCSQDPGRSMQSA